MRKKGKNTERHEGSRPGPWEDDPFLTKKRLFRTEVSILRQERGKMLHGGMTRVGLQTGGTSYLLEARAGRAERGKGRAWERYRRAHEYRMSSTMKGQNGTS